MAVVAAVEGEKDGNWWTDEVGKSEDPADADAVDADCSDNKDHEMNLK